MHTCMHVQPENTTPSMANHWQKHNKQNLYNIKAPRDFWAFFRLLVALLPQLWLLGHDGTILTAQTCSWFPTSCFTSFTVVWHVKIYCYFTLSLGTYNPGQSVTLLQLNCIFSYYTPIACIAAWADLMH